MNIFGRYVNGQEYIKGSAEGDMIYPLGGSDTVDGILGYDVVVINWESTNFNISTVNGLTYLDAVSGASSGDRVELRNVEEIKFLDKSLSLLINDLYTSSEGSDFFNGGPGTDTVTYARERSGYEFLVDNAGIDVISTSGIEGADRLTGIERLRFKDIAVAYDMDGNAGEAVKTLGAVFGAQAVDVPAFVGIALDLMDRLDYSYLDLMDVAINVRLGLLAENARSIVSMFYSNLFGFDPTEAEINYFSGFIERGEFSPSEFGVIVADTDLNKENAGLVGLMTKGVNYYDNGHLL